MNTKSIETITSNIRNTKPGQFPLYSDSRDLSQAIRTFSSWVAAAFDTYDSVAYSAYLDHMTRKSESEIDVLKATIANLKSDAEIAQERIETLQADLNKALDEIDNVTLEKEADIRDIIADYEARLKTVRKERDAMQKTVDALCTDLDDADEKVESLKNELAAKQLPPPVDPEKLQAVLTAVQTLTNSLGFDFVLEPGEKTPISE